MDVLWKHAGEIGQAAGATVLLTILSWIGALVLGTVVAALRMSAVRPARITAAGYVAMFRNVPLPVQMVLFVFGLPLVGIIYPLFASAVIALVLYTAAFVAETLTGGINTVARGELEAARALGFGPGRVLRHIALPQAFASVVQPLGNVLITMMKNTSVAAVVGVAELAYVSDEIATKEAQTFVVFAAAVVVYLLLGLILGVGVGYLEKKVAFQR
ncbi:amino acid ABC transporter permease [Dactylosporangium darangshiense]|uniref:Amino acid ABC transporter permease n=1 Tax=Dactylosporangium darangshiense TaxID=579108 RepID=A0ABP8DTX1_9ACTN